MIIRCFAALCVNLVGWLAFAAPTPSKAPLPKGPTEEQISKAIDELASPRFVVRERASRFLWEAGRHAEAALVAATRSKDEERSTRAQTILDRFSWGLYPDTSAELTKLIEKFRGGDLGVRTQAIGEIIRLKPVSFATIRKLIQKENDRDARAQMFYAMRIEARRAIPTLIVANKLDDAEALLEICLAQAGHSSYTDFAAFCHLRGTVQAAIEQMEELRKTGSAAEVQRAIETLVYLYRIRKDWPAARKAVAQANNSVLAESLAWESNDWKSLAAQPIAGVEDERGTKAAYYRLAGNRTKFEELIGELKQELTGVEGDDKKAYTLALALLLNGRGADAVDLLKVRPKSGASLAFDMLCAQLKFKDAFALANKAAKELEKGVGEGDFEQQAQRDELDLERAKVLAGLGDRDAATQIFRSVVARSPRLNIGFRGVDSVQAIVRAGMYDLAVECVANMMVANDKDGGIVDGSTLLDPLLGDKKHFAQVWWAAYRLETPGELPTRTLEKVIAFAQGKPDKKQAEQLVVAIGKLKERAGKGKEIPDAWILLAAGATLDFATAEAYRSVGSNDKAEEYFKKLVNTKGPEAGRADFLDEFLDNEFGSTRVPARYKYLLAYADFLLAQKRPSEAATSYHQAWTLAPFRALPLFMQGHALKVSGKEAEGTRLMGLSHWVSLSDDALRTSFAEDLSRRGFDRDSRQEMDLILTTAWFQSFQYGNALVRLARMKARQKDYAAASLMYEKEVVGLSRSGAVFLEKRAYLTVPELARTYRAQALLAVGKVSEALVEVNLGLEALPGNIDLAIAMVPDLDRAGKVEEAGELYAKVKASFVAAIKDYGNSADLRNSLAWMMVNCNRDLAEARKHAEKAVELAPRSAGYVDTLAEIHFRQKDRTKALEFMKQCLKLEPDNPYYRKQVERFEKKPFESPLPDEETGDD